MFARSFIVGLAAGLGVGTVILAVVLARFGKAWEERYRAPHE